MKQTAVEWLKDTWLNYPDLCTYEKIQEWFEQAKALEKGQIIDAYNKNLTGLDMLEQEESGLNWAEQYYNETYASNDPTSHNN